MTIAEGAIVALVGWSPSIILLATLALLALTIVLMVLGGFFEPSADSKPRKGIEQVEEGSATGEDEPLLDARELSEAREPSLNTGEVPAGGDGSTPGARNTPISWDGSSPDARETPADDGEQLSNVEEVPLDAQQVVAIAKRYGLTQRETEVLGLILRDLTTQQMADDLVITKSTVKFHVTNILKKTGSETRQQLIEKLSDEADQESQPR